MAKSGMKYPRITPMRTLALLRELDYRQGVRVGEGNGCESGIDSARRALVDHVRAALAKARK